MSEAERSSLPEVIPEEWRNNYEDLTITPTPQGGDFLYGVKEGGERERLSWEPLENSIEEKYGVKPLSREWSEEEYNKNPELWEARIEAGRLRTRANELENQVESLIEANQRLQEEIRQLREDLGSRLEKLEQQRREEVVIPLADTASEPRSIEVPASSREEPEPEVEPQPEVSPSSDEDAEPSRGEGWRARWNRVAGKIGAVITGRSALAHASTSLSNGRREVTIVEEERDGYARSERRVGAAALIGGVAIVGAGILAYWLWQRTGHNIAKGFNGLAENQAELNARLGNLEHIVDPNGSKPGNAISHLHQEVHKLQNMYEGRVNGGQGNIPEYGGAHTASLEYYGDTIWYDVERQLQNELGYQPNDSQIAAATQHVLNINGLSWEGARHLPVGFDYRIPNNLATTNR